MSARCIQWRIWKAYSPPNEAKTAIAKILRFWTRPAYISISWEHQFCIYHSVPNQMFQRGLCAVQWWDLNQLRQLPRPWLVWGISLNSIVHQVLIPCFVRKCSVMWGLAKPLNSAVRGGALFVEYPYLESHCLVDETGHGSSKFSITRWIGITQFIILIIAKGTGNNNIRKGQLLN